MDTKEAIKWLNEMRDIDITCTPNEYKGHIEQIDEIITLLKRLEKFEEMWEELNDRYFDSVGGLMNLVKQKYFPKGGK